eukprot:2855928-Alexandrium_andersonii.AAC.1
MPGAHPRCTLGRSGLRAGDRPPSVPAGRSRPEECLADGARCFLGLLGGLPLAGPRAHADS